MYVKHICQEMGWNMMERWFQQMCGALGGRHCVFGVQHRVTSPRGGKGCQLLAELVWMKASRKDLEEPWIG